MMKFPSKSSQWLKHTKQLVAIGDGRDSVCIAFKAWLFLLLMNELEINNVIMYKSQLGVSILEVEK